MSKIEIYVPAMGEGIIEATITRWLKKEGERVNEDESLVEIATDKVDTEIPAPASGILEKILKPQGAIPRIGEIIAILSTEAESTSPIETFTPEKTSKQAKIQSEGKPENKYSLDVSSLEPSENSLIAPSRTPGGKFLSPLVRSIAKEEKISLHEMDQIQGTGADGRITKNDLLIYASKKGNIEEPLLKEQPKSEPAKNSLIGQPNPIKTASDSSVEIIEMDRIRKLIAEHMVRSKQTSPHVTSFAEADMTSIVKWREQVKYHFENQEHEKLTYTPIFFQAVAKAIRDFPMMNVSVEGTNILLKKNINLGMATALPSGNLIVPVVKNADQKNLLGLVKSINDLANRARLSKLIPDEIQGGTFTITNLGSFGTLAGTPIINQPEAAILGIGAIKKKPAVIETPEGDFIGIRHKVILSLAYDHRIIDGMLAGKFLKQVVEYLENFDEKQNI